ncbi:helix-turn-helix domain-containing protein [Spirosoma horti]
MTINYYEQQPSDTLRDFIFNFWKTQNNTGTKCHYTVVPDAGIELIISILPDKPIRTDLFGLSTHSLDISIPAGAVLFGIRFKLLAVEYLLQTTLPTNSFRELPTTFKGVELQVETPLASFIDSISTHLHQQINSMTVDPRKRKLLNDVYSSKGAISVHTLALETGWAARQINRYFNATFGLPLKEYLEQLLFFSSLPQISQGDFYPQAYYYDQSHFIRQSKKHTGSTPKQLYQQRAVRFVQLGQYTEE